MNILIVASKFSPEYSGPGVRIPRLYDDIKDELGIETISVICNGIEYTENENYTFKDIPVQRVVASLIRKNRFPFNLLPARIHNALAYFRENILTLKALKKRNNIDLVHIIGHSGGTAAAILWASKNRVPVLIELVNATAVPEQRFFFIRKVSPAGRFKIVSISKGLEQKCLEYGFKKDDIWCRPNPVNETLFSPEIDKKTALRSELSNFKEEDVVICSIGKFIPRKNQIFLIDVLKKLPSTYKLVLAGPIVESGCDKNRDHLYLYKIQERIKAYNLEDRVQLVRGFIGSASYMKAYDIYAIPGWDEGLGTPMLEAIACGMPVVANNVGAFREWIDDGKNGFLCDLDAKEWVNAILSSKKFSVEQRLEESSNILEKCGDSIINAGYIEQIKKLTN